MTIKEFEIQNALGSLSDVMKEKLVYSKNTPKKILTILSKDEDWWVRHGVANNPNTPKEVLTILSKDKDKWVRNKARNYLKNKSWI